MYIYIITIFSYILRLLLFKIIWSKTQKATWGERRWCHSAFYWAVSTAYQLGTGPRAPLASAHLQPQSEPTSSAPPFCCPPEVHFKLSPVPAVAVPLFISSIDPDYFRWQASVHRACHTSSSTFIWCKVVTGSGWHLPPPALGCGGTWKDTCIFQCFHVLRSGVCWEFPWSLQKLNCERQHMAWLLVSGGAPQNGVNRWTQQVPPLYR